MKKFQVAIRFTKIVALDAESAEIAKENAIAKMIDDMALANESIENELETELICADCGLSLKHDEEVEDGRCANCEAVFDNK